MANGVKSPSELAGPRGSNIDIGIDFDKSGKLEKVEVDGELVPLEQPEPESNSPEAEDVAEKADSSTDNLIESFDRLIEASTEVWNNFLDYVPYLLLALGVFILTIFLASILKAGAQRMLARTGVSFSLSEVLARFFYVLIWIASALLIAKLLFPGFELDTALTYLGVASLVVGFVFRDIFENAFAGLLILWRFPFEIGDYIEVETDPPVCGQVHDIWVRSTLIREVTDELVVMPNAKIYQNAVRVTTWRENSRQTLSVTVAYDSDLDEARSVVADAIRACERVAENPPVMVFTRRFADSGVELQAAWWAQSGPLEEIRSQDQILAAVHKALHEAGIEIPYPYRTLTFKQDNPLNLTSGTADSEAEG